MRVIVSYYASGARGSDYRSGADYIAFASSVGFKLAIIADLEYNDAPADLMEANPGISVVKVPSLVRKQKLLYRFTDFIPQTFWHYRVAKWLRAYNNNVEILWIQNGAQPWLPLRPYFSISQRIIWGPVGGGESVPHQLLRHVGPIPYLRETTRNIVQSLALRRKLALIRRDNSPQILPIARTEEARVSLESVFPMQPIPVIPEMLHPMCATVIERVPCVTPRFIWVGQDIPRKNLSLALEIFRRMKKMEFPDATMDIFGVNGDSRLMLSGVTYHGWVSRIDWASYRNQGVLLLTSFREGMPSTVLEAASNGLLCVTSEVGSIPTLNQTTVVVLPSSEYPDYSPATYQRVIKEIKGHLSSHKVVLKTINHEGILHSHLKTHAFI